MASKIKKISIPIIILVVCFAVTAMLMSSRKPPEKAASDDVAFLVDVKTAEIEDVRFIVDSQGTVQPKVATRLSSEVSGKVEWVADNFIEGGMVTKGDTLFRIEQADYATELKLAQAELARAQASLEEELARGKVAEQEWRSVKGNTAPELGLRKPQLAKEKANVIAAQAQLDRAQRNLERTSVRAPYDGLVKSKNIDLGQFVTTGSDLGMLYATDVAEVRMPLSDSDLAFLDLRDTEGGFPNVILSARVAGKEQQWTGQLVRDEGVLDDQRRVIYAIAQVTDPYLREAGQAAEEGTPLKFGRFVKAQISGQQANNLVVLPRNVLRLDGTILTVDGNNTLRVKPVVVQRADEQSVYISSGINAGDQVVVSAVPNPYDGMDVRLAGDDPADDDVEQEAQTEIAQSGDA